MNWIYNLFRKIFLVKEIISKKGTVHFRRYRVLSTPWFSIYLHNILQSDQDNDLHDHPFNFKSVILSGSYCEKYSLAPTFDKVIERTYYAGDVIEHQAEDVHKITLLSKDVWTLVFTSDHNRVWGYYSPSNGWMDHKTYRQAKNNFTTKYGVKVTIYNSYLFENWVWVDGQRFETTDQEDAHKFAMECESKNLRGLYSVQKIEDKITN